MYVLLVINFILIYVSAQDRPKIESQNGNLILTAGKHKNVQIETTGVGGLFINQVNVLAVVESVHEALNNFKNDDKPVVLQNFDQIMNGVTLRLETIEKTSNLTIFPRIVSLLTQTRRRLGLVQRKLRTLLSLLNLNECLSNPCSNGGTCQDMYNSFLCHCADGWEGPRCETDVNECSLFTGTDLGCQNGATCVNKPGTYECTCADGWFGTHCTKRSQDCSFSAEMCGHGTCISQTTGVGIKCICDQGWKTDGIKPACNVDVNECEENRPPCSSNPPVKCINLPGTFYCGHCPIGFTGNGLHCSDIDECAVFNGGCSVNPMVQCINTPGSRMCGLCPPGYIGNGMTCTYQGGVCGVNNGGCHSYAQCRDNSRISSTYVECICPAGYSGNGIGPAGCLKDAINLCNPNPCEHGDCTVQNNDIVCNCNRKYTGRLCNIRKNPCDSNPCQNGGSCKVVGFSYSCICTNSYTGIYCETERQGCGRLVGPSGTLVYPFPNGTLTTTDRSCAWVINTTPNKVLNITFQIFNFPRCGHNWLQINDGSNSGTQLIGRFCSTTLPKGGNFVTTTHNLYLWFKHDGLIPRPRFELTWNETDPICGGDINVTTHGSFKSPGAPGSYPPNRDCYWRFKAPFGKLIQFHFFSFNIGNKNNCSYDYLEFFSGLEPSDPLIIKYCNSYHPEPLSSKGNEVLAHFHSGEGSSNSGFQITYSVVGGMPGCGGIYTRDQGEITVPTIDGNYAANILCEYKIKLPTYSKVKITFSQFDIDASVNCQHDYVAIYTGASVDSPLIGRYCISQIPASIVSMGSEFLIVFNSDTSMVKTGFRIHYEVVCGGTTTDPTGVIESPNYPNPQTIQTHKECIYEIVQPYGNTIVLNISDISIGNGSQNCINGYLEVRDGNDDNSTLIGKYCDKAPIIYSTYNILRLRYVVRYGTVTGFRLQYSTINNNGCGGILTSKIGSVESPPDLHSYINGLNCTWLIRAPQDNLIQITWVRFLLEDSPTCIYDRVTVIDNGTEPGSVIGVYCGNKMPPTLTSSANMLTVKMEIHSNINFEGFLLTYIFIHEKNVCGGKYFTSSGVLKSPFYPKLYPVNRDCTWIITVPPGQKIMLNVTHFDVEHYYNCRYDYVEVRNGGTAASPLVGKFCGQTINNPIPSHANQMYIRFKSDMAKTASGFSINWDSVATGCGGTLTSPTGTIMSPHYPEPYSKNTECYWKISISAGSIIQLVFADLDLQTRSGCILDYIEIYDGIGTHAKSLGKFCDLGNVPPYMRSTTNSMTIKFRSDFSFPGRGFHIQYSTICQTTLKGYQGVIESPNFPLNNPRNQDCLWEVEVAEGNKINITFSHFELYRSIRRVGKNCDDEAYVQISYKDLKDEPSPTYLTYGTYCGFKVPEDMNIHSNVAQIRLVTDTYVMGAGFRLEWKIDGCGGILTHPEGTITTPNYPNAYPLNTKCEWLIQTDYGQSIQITFSKMDLEHNDECTFDFVSIYSGSDATSPLQSKFCHVGSNPIILTSSGNQMFVTFESDMSHRGRGFSADYQTLPSKCGGKLSGKSGTIHSPNYPKNFDKNDTCIWQIEVEENHVIHLTFKDLDLFIECVKSYIKIFDGPTQAYPVLERLCGNKTPNNTFTSTGSHMTIEMVTSSFFSTKGFLAEYSMGCGASIKTQSSGIINFSETTLLSTEYDNCSWTIESERPDEHIFLTFTHLASTDCYGNTTGIDVYDGDNKEAPLIGHYCGSSTQPMIRSTGSKLHLEVKNTDNQMSARYSVVDTECGGTLESGQGFFATPNFPNNYPVDIQCEWTLKASPGSKVTVQFSDFQISKSDNCNEDYLEIREVNSTGKSIDVFCGDDIPTNITAASSLWLFFRSDKPVVGEDSTTAKGFKAEYSLTHGNTLYGPKGQIGSPLYPRSYINNALFDEFTWKIVVELRYQISIKFLDFDIDFTDTECYTTYLEIFDGVNEDERKIGSYCGPVAPDVVTTTSNVAFIKIHYDHIRKGSKFLLEWQQILNQPIERNTTKPRIPGCGSEDTIFIEDDTPYNFSLQNYPGNYPMSLTCTWIFSTTNDKHLSVHFPVIDLDTIISCVLGDAINIFSGLNGTTNFKLVHTICNSNDTSSYETSNLMKVSFKSGPPGRFYARIKAGFLGYVETVCGGSMSGPNGMIEIKKMKKDLATEDCEWQITVRSGRTIKVEFEKFQLGDDGKCNTYLMLKNGQYPHSPLLGAGKFCRDELPTALETSGNFLFVKFYSLNQNAKFKFKYSEVSITCGGEIVLTQVDNSTIINSPNYPSVPTPHSECIWVILVPGGEAVRLDFQERFDLNDKSNCTVEGVEIRDGGTRSSPLIGTFCNDMPSSQKTVANMMFIRYYTNDDFPKNGFKAKVSIASCGGIIRASEGNIKSPNFNMKKLYPVNVDCYWEIVAPTGHSVELNFEVLDLPDSLTKNCSYDYVSLSQYGIINQTVNTIGKYCGRFPISGITSSSNQVYVHFQTGSVSRQYNGFKINFNASQTECGGVLTTDFGTFASSGYPLMLYPSQCEWTIKVAKGQRIKIEVLDLDLDWSIDQNSQGIAFINADDGIDPMLILGLGSSGITIRSSDNVMRVYFWSGQDFNRRGFKAKYTSDEPTICIGNFNQENGTITTPNDSAYRCTWMRSSIDSINKTIALMINASFSNPHFNECVERRTSLQIFSGDSKLSDADICKDTNGIKIIRSSLPILTFRASQDNPKNIINFTMTYKSYACGGVISDSYGYVTSPGYPKQSEDYECSWIIKTDMAQSLLLKFIDFDLGDDCDKSYLSIYNGDSLKSPKISKYCMNSKPTNIQSQSNSLRVEYHVERNSKGSKGFNFTYEPVTKGCGGIYHTSTSVLETPGYSKPYPDNAECLWEIRAKPGYHIALSFIDRFQIETSDNCAKDFVQVFNNFEDATKETTPKYCGREPPFNSFNSTSNKLFVLFRSDARTNGIGFRARWTHACGGTFQADDTLRYIVSPGYPEDYANRLNCKYNIVAPNKYININFEDFELEIGAPLCMFDNLTVEDTRSFMNHRKSLTFCGSDTPFPIRQLNKVTFTFTTDQWLTKRGFKLSYQIDDCGGNITEQTMISKREEPSSVPQFQGFYKAQIKSCLWNIQAPKKYRVILRVLEMNLMSTYKCHSESVSIDNGDVGTFCGHLTEDDLPIIHSQNETMTVSLQYSYFSETNITFTAAVYFMKGPDLGCGGDITVANGTSKTIETLHDPNTDCAWKFTTGTDYTFKVEFLENTKCTPTNNATRSDNCTCVLYEIRDGETFQSELIDRLCDFVSDSSVTYYTSKSNVFIRILTSSSASHTPKIRVTSIMGLCGPSILQAEETPKYLTSPNFPLTYPKNLKCVWQIKSVSYVHKVHVKFIELNLNNSVNSVDNSCNNKDRLVFKGTNYIRRIPPSQSSMSMFSVSFHLNLDSTTICRDEDVILEYYLRDYPAYLTFYANNEEKHGKGFKLEYQIPTCNRNYTELSGSIVRNWVDSSCSIYITAPENYTIALYFSKFAMFPIHCELNKFEVYDGDATKEKLLETCETILPRPVFSTGNQLYINVINNQHFQAKNEYDITYIANNKSRGCGGEIYGLKEGAITSPMYPETYTVNSLCTWTITVPNGLNAAIKFLTFDIQGNCKENYLAISTYYEDEEANRRVFCSLDNPAQIISNSKITIDYKTNINNAGTGWSLKFVALTSVLKTYINSTNLPVN